MNLILLISLIGTNILVLITLIYMLIKLKELIKTVSLIDKNKEKEDQINEEALIKDIVDNLDDNIINTNNTNKKKIIKRVY